MTTGPMTSRMSSKPMPGQLPANVEYRRRNAHLHTSIRSWAARSDPDRAAGVTLLRLGVGGYRRGGTLPDARAR